MNQYLTEVMNRLSMGGLVGLLILLVVCLIIASIRSKKPNPAQKIKPAIPCPMCGQEVK